MNNQRHSDAIEYDRPGGPTHPADVLLAQRRHERRMREIRELDIEQWVASLVDD